MNIYLSRYDIEDLQKYLSTVLAFFALMLIFSYLYFINSSVLNTVVREQNNKEISQTVLKISNLENKYIVLKSEMNIDMARSLGFKDDFSRVHFSSENTNVTGRLSLLGNEI